MQTDVSYLADLTIVPLSDGPSLTDTIAPAVDRVLAESAEPIGRSLSGYAGNQFEGLDSEPAATN